jgi:hypothetical protein
MELSPLAKEKLAKIGDLTPEEKARLKYEARLSQLLADYFTNKINPDDLRQELKKQKDTDREPMAREAQLKLIDAINLSTSDIDFERERRGLLALETLKRAGKSSTMEANLNLLEKLRRQYREEREKNFATLKSNVERQVRAATQQMAAQAQRNGTGIDIQGSIEATARASPEWKNFVTRHDEAYTRKFKEQLVQLRERL